MDLSTDYLGLHLAHPLMPGASPMADDLDAVRRLEDAGASAIVMRSLFEEQIEGEQLGAARHLFGHCESAEAATWFPDTDVFALGPDTYLEQIRAIRAAVHVPVIASLNGTTPGGWTGYAQLMEEAGASALELNLYDVPTNPDENAAAVESRLLEVVAQVRGHVALPLAVKLSPSFTALPHFVRALELAGVDGVVLFNRWYQPDIELESLEVRRTLHLSGPSELPLRLRWLAILSPFTGLSLAASGGVHAAPDAIKALMAGAHAVQMVAALLQRGPQHLGVVLGDLRTWLEEHEYASLQQLVGSMNLARCPDAAHYERGNYMALLQSWHTSPAWRT
ncbi:MAG TPA: dihydroorotate dehydrogenase-like protein [Planctomycetota bacterium]|nr:dihydroorotate dehydrogenase-like protein [Planctomycetota bacterium]